VLVLGALVLALGTLVGVDPWLVSERTGRPATTGTVMLAALPVMIGVPVRSCGVPATRAFPRAFG